jgi:Putative antitoxin of bacterial toxin-antitoxin system, YdaS/YdaT
LAYRNKSGFKKRVDHIRVIALDCAEMKGRHRRTNAVEAAVELAGGVAKVAMELGVSRQTVYNWIAAGDMMRARYKDVVALSKVSGVPVGRLAGDR